MWPRLHPMRTRRPQRLWALWLLAFAMLVNPALMAIGDAHSALMGAQLHAHDAGETATQDAEPARDTLLFALEHAAHCCAHVVADMHALALSSPAWSTRVALPRPAPLRLHARPAALLRPPIG
jgi:hypothetical protein